MAEASITRFGEFIERVIGGSRLELAGGKLAKTFLQEAERSEAIIADFIGVFSPPWDDWKRDKGKHLISPFIGEQGGYILKLWLSFVFAFNYQRLEAGMEKGGSMVDTQGWIEYTYTPEERKLIKETCKKYEISMEEREITRILITNAVKSIDPTLSKIVETSYRMYIDKIEYKEAKKQLKIIVEVVGRIG